MRILVVALGTSLILQGCNAFCPASFMLPLRSGRADSCKPASVRMSLDSGRPLLRSDVLGLAGAAAAALIIAPADVLAKNQNSDGKWAAHEGPFTEEEIQGFTETPSGLKYKDVVAGDGATPQQGQTVTAHYAGYLLSNGKKFDASYDRGKPFSFKVGTGQVIKGWDEAFLSMKIGTKRIILVPPNLGYGSRAVGGGLIPADSTLVFYTELVRVAP